MAPARSTEFYGGKPICGHHEEKLKPPLPSREAAANVASNSRQQLHLAHLLTLRTSLVTTTIVKLVEVTCGTLKSRLVDLTYFM